jgi:hypothetical protein
VNEACNPTHKFEREKERKREREREREEQRERERKREELQPKGCLTVKHGADQAESSIK